MTPTMRKRRERQLDAAIDELSRHERALGYLAMAEIHVAELKRETRGKYESDFTWGCSDLRQELHSKIDACEYAVKILRVSLKEVR